MMAIFSNPEAVIFTGEPAEIRTAPF